jgi:hypothetical protein
VNNVKGLAALAGAVAAVLAVAIAVPLMTARLIASPGGHAAASTAITLRQTTADCTAGRLRLAAGGAAAYRGMAYDELQVVNTGHATCDFPAEPELTGRDSRGTAVSIRYTTGTASVVSLAPGQYAVSMLTAPGICAGLGHAGARTFLTWLGARLPGGGVAADARWRTPMDCGVPSASRFVLLPKAAPVAAPLAAARLSAPASARAGTAIEYSVRIASLSRGALALLPCPSFQARLFGAAVNVRVSGSLGCAGKFLATGTMMTVRGRLIVPSSARGTIKLIWISPAFGGLAAGTLIDITA